MKDEPENAEWPASAAAGDARAGRPAAAARGCPSCALLAGRPKTAGVFGRVASVAAH